MPDKYFSLKFFHGVVKHMNPRLIPDDKLADGNNIYFHEGRVAQRWGMETFGGNLPLSGPITQIVDYELIRLGVRNIIAFTTKDAYRYNWNTGNFDFITAIYITGTADCDADSVVDGTSTVWDFANWPPDVAEIKFGVTDPNVPSIIDDNWWVIESYTSAILLTLADVGPDTDGPKPYVIRLCWSGDIDEPHSIAIPYDPVEQEKILIATNGADPIRKWTGTGFFTDLGEYVIEGDTTSGSATIDNITSTAQLRPGMTVVDADGDVPAGATIVSIEDSTTVIVSLAATATSPDQLITFGTKPRWAKHISYFGSVSYEQLITANTKEAAVNLPQNMEFSDAGETEVFSGAYSELLDTNDEIMGIVPLGTRLIIYKAYSITVAWATPTSVQPFDFNQNTIRNIGTPSIRTVVNQGKYHIFFGSDNIYMFDGMSIVPVGEEIIHELLLEINKTFLSRSFALPIRSENLYCLFVPTGDSEYPDKVYVYNYSQKTWTIWDFPPQLTAYGLYTQEYAPSWTDLLVATDATGDTATSTILDDLSISALTLEIGMAVEAASDIDPYTVITDIISATEVYILPAATGTTNDLAVEFFLSWDNIDERWSDLIVYEDTARYLAGDSAGNLYELNARLQDDIRIADGTGNTYTTTTIDTISFDTGRLFAGMNVSGTGVASGATIVSIDSSTAITVSAVGTAETGTALLFWGDIDCTVETKDYPLNDEKHTFLLLEAVVGLIQQITGIWVTNNVSLTPQVRIRASVDFGANWSGWVTVDLDNTVEYFEEIINYMQYGRQVRFQLENLNGSPFELESLNIGFNETGGVIL